MHHLPLQPTRFINRTHELAALQQSFCERGIRLVTLTGPGGVGKTRLAIAAAEALEDSGQYRDGVWFVDLTEVPDAEHVPLAIARALGLSESDEGSALDQLQPYLHARRLLLVLDNLEHLTGSGSIVAELLAGCPDVDVLATSREPLRLRWEHQLRVPPLELPQPGARLDSDMGELPAAMALFEDRARAADADFALTPANAEIVAELVRRVDGLPLAIELVAGHVRTFPVGELLARLWEPSITSACMRDAPARHHSLRAAIEWSYASLIPREQVLFRQLAVFDGGWTLDALTSIADGDVAEMVDDLASLVDKSLITRDATESRVARYRLLQPMRMFAAAQLASSDQADALYRRHAEYYVRLVEKADTDMGAEEHNLRAGWRWAHQHEDLALTRRIAAVLARLQPSAPDRGAMAEAGAKRIPSSGPLSERETSVLRLIAQGMRSKEIGRELYMAERTVKAHVTSILNKLGADTRSQALGLAVRNGLL